MQLFFLVFHKCLDVLCFAIATDFLTTFFPIPFNTSSSGVALYCHAPSILLFLAPSHTTTITPSLSLPLVPLVASDVTLHTLRIAACVSCQMFLISWRLSSNLQKNSCLNCSSYSFQNLSILLPMTFFFFKWLTMKSALTCRSCVTQQPPGIVRQYTGIFHSIVSSKLDPAASLSLHIYVTVLILSFLKKMFNIRRFWFLHNSNIAYYVHFTVP